jgi:beta-N-acetylhexosaminidase
VSRLRSAVASGEVEEGTINNAVGRIIKAKKRLGLIAPVEADYDRHIGLSSSITDRSITLVKHTPGLLPLNEKRDFRIIVAGDPPLPSALLFKDSLQLSSGFDDMAVPGDEIALFAIFTSVAAWKGSSGISGTIREKLSGLIKRTGKSIVVSFGSPYVLRYFGEADILIAAYEPTPQAQEAVIKCLKGEMDFMGRLPVQLNGVGR